MNDRNLGERVSSGAHTGASTHQTGRPGLVEAADLAVALSVLGVSAAEGELWIGGTAVVTVNGSLEL